ncbi:TraB family [Musa troglodytarum]|uniref:TraB family n=1 Tax=Musa troglodytarum TaxID=320322 RepID=A0A9E7I8A9_9LILI|nr:TraB family [Musa troglodytarum]
MKAAIAASPITFHLASPFPLFRSPPPPPLRSWPPRNPKASIRPPPSGFDYKAEVMQDSRAAAAAAHPELMDLVEDGSLVLVEKGRFGPVPSWRTEFVEPEAIWLIGTSHLSEKSASDVERVARAVRPDNVVVELFLWSHQPQHKLRWTKCSCFALAASCFSSKLSSDANRSFGDEFRAARKVSEELGVQIVLGDRPIEITLERAWSSLTWSQKVRLVLSLFRGISSSSSELPKSNMKDQEMDGSPYKLYESLSVSYPSLLQPLIHERDTYLAWSLKRSKAVNKSRKVLGVIGKGHMNGVVYALISDLGDLRFRDLVRKTSGESNSGWLSNFLESLVRDTLLGFLLWILYEQLMNTFQHP